MDIQLRTAVRIILGARKATPIQWLPTMSAIAPPHMRRKAATSMMHQHIESMNENIPLKNTVNNAPTTTRLKSRRPFYISTYALHLAIPPPAQLEYRKNNPPTGADITEDPTAPLPGFHMATRRQW